MTILRLTKRWSARTFVSLGVISALACAGGADAKKVEPPYEYGPPPSWDRYRELGELTLRARLVDPDSAKFIWHHGYRQGGWRPFLSRMIRGYTTCGYVNSKNRMGGYAGSSFFVIVIDNDQILYADISRSSGDYVGETCLEAIRREMFWSALEKLVQF
jgi:hypothetical protein